MYLKTVHWTVVLLPTTLSSQSEPRQEVVAIESRNLLCGLLLQPVIGFSYLFPCQRLSNFMLSSRFCSGVCSTDYQLFLYSAS